MPQLAAHGQAQIKITVIDQPRRGGKDALVWLAVGLNQSVHGGTSLKGKHENASAEAEL
jgi:hypothetical protein